MGEQYATEFPENPCLFQECVFEGDWFTDQKLWCKECVETSFKAFKQRQTKRIEQLENALKNIQCISCNHPVGGWIEGVVQGPVAARFCADCVV